MNRMIIKKGLRPDNILTFYKLLLEQNTGIFTNLKVHDVLHAALEHMTRLGIINRNHANFVQAPKAPATEMAVLNESQVCHFLVSVKGHRWKALFVLAIVTGARQMEILGL